MERKLAWLGLMIEFKWDFSQLTMILVTNLYMVLQSHIGIKFLSIMALAHLEMR